MQESGRDRREQEATGGGKSGCLWLLLAALLFVALVLGTIYYLASQPDAARASIESCWSLVRSEERAPAQGRLPVDKVQTRADCEEMERSFKKNFPNAALPASRLKDIGRP